MAETTAVKMPDGTTLQFPSTMTREAMQSAAAGWWQQNGGAATAPAAQPVAPNANPMLPSPDTDTRSTQQFLSDTGAAPENPLIDARAALEPQAMRTEGGTPMDLLRSGASGVARGATELAALPDTAGGGLDWIYEKLGLIPEGARENVPTVRGAIRGASSALTSGGTSYEPQTTGGEYAQTVGEFVGGGAGVRPGILGGLLSEGAGQATEGTSMEPWARAIGGIAGGIAGTKRPTSAPVGNPNTVAGQRALAANDLRREGINVTKGQQSNSPLLRRLEGTLDAPDMQPEQFTSVIMKRLGSNSDVATPQALRSVQDDLVQQMDDAVRGVAIVPDATLGQRAVAIGDGYIERVAAGALTPRIRGISNEINALARSNTAVPLDRLKTWRSDVGKFTVSNDAPTREAAHSLRRIIDEMTDTALQAANRTDDIAKLSGARQTYRDFIAVRDASTRAGDAGVGILSPTQLNQSMIRSIGRENYGTGRTTPTSDFTRSAASMMRSAPAVNSGGMRGIENLPMLLGGAGGYAAGGPLGFMAGVAAPMVGQSAMRSAPIQALLTNPATVFGQASRNIPGLLAQEQNR